MRTALFWVIMQRVVVISYQYFGTTYQTRRQMGYPKTLVRNYHYSWCNTQKRTVHLKILIFNALACHKT